MLEQGWLRGHGARTVTQAPEGPSPDLSPTIWRPLWAGWQAHEKESLTPHPLPAPHFHFAPGQ